MQLPGFDVLALIATTPYADVHRATRTYDGAPVRVELLRSTDPAVADRLAAAAAALRRADGRHLVRVRQVLDDPLGVVRDDVPGEAFDGVDPVRVIADALDALAGLHALGLAHGALTAQDLLLDASVPLRPVVRVTGWGLAGVLAAQPPDPADDVRDAGRLLEQLAGSLPSEALALVAADPAARPTAAQARDLLRQLRGMPAAAVPVRPRSATPVPAAPVPVTPVPAPPVPVTPVPAAPVPVTPVPAPPVPVTPVPATPSPRDRRRPLRAAGIVLGALTVLGIGVVGGRLLAGEDPAALPQAVPATPPPAGPYVLPAITRPDGLVVERTWLLEQDGAVLRGTTVVRNPTLQTVSAQVDEVVPKSIATDVDDLDFTPAPDQVVERDPVVRFAVRSLPPAGSLTWTFVAQLPQPVQREALPTLAADADAARAEHEQRQSPAAVSPTPTS